MRTIDLPWAHVTEVKIIPDDLPAFLTEFTPLLVTRERLVGIHWFHEKVYVKLTSKMLKTFFSYNSHGQQCCARCLLENMFPQLGNLFSGKTSIFKVIQCFNWEEFINTFITWFNVWCNLCDHSTSCVAFLRESITTTVDNENQNRWQNKRNTL